MIAEPIIFFNILITMMALWLAMAINSKFLRPAILNKKRFAMYELRDQLALLAMRGTVDERSEEYVTLIRLINGVIYSTKGFKITELLNMYSAIYKDKKLLAHLENIRHKIENKAMPDEFRAMVPVFFRLARDIYNLKVWGLRAILKPVLFLVSIFAHGVKAARATKLVLAKQLDEISSTQSKLEENITRFSV